MNELEREPINALFLYRSSEAYSSSVSPEDIPSMTYIVPNLRGGAITLILATLRLSVSLGNTDVMSEITVNGAVVSNSEDSGTFGKNDVVRLRSAAFVYLNQNDVIKVKVTINKGSKTVLKGSELLIVETAGNRHV